MKRSITVTVEDGRATTEGEMHALAVEGLRDLRREVAPTMRETLSGAIKRHGGPTAVVEQMGLERGTKEYKAAVRHAQRASTQTATEKRNVTGVKEKYAALYEKVLGKETMQRIKTGAKGAPGPLPLKGSITMTVAGEIEVSSDIRDRAVAMHVDAKGFDNLMADPIGAWSGKFETFTRGYGVNLHDVESIEFLYETEDD